MAKKEPQLPSDLYHARAMDCFKGMGWMAGLTLLLLHERRGGMGIALVMAILCIIFMAAGCTMYVFGHKAKMLEAKDLMTSLPKKSAEA